MTIPEAMARKYHARGPECGGWESVEMWVAHGMFEMLKLLALPDDFDAWGGDATVAMLGGADYIGAVIRYMADYTQWEDSVLTRRMDFPEPEPPRLPDWQGDRA